MTSAAIPITGGGASVLAGAATGAQQKGESITDQLVMEVLKNSATNFDMATAVQTRPQLILPQPLPAKQYNENAQPIGNVQATTRSGQKRNDMNNFLTTLGNVVKGGINQKNQRDERDLMADLAIIQAAASNPDDPHNKAILDAMAQDPKKMKRLQKALGYNPLSGEAPPPEAKTLQKFGAQQVIKQGIGGKVQGQPQQPPAGGAMQNLLSRMPNTPQLNPLVMIQGELIKAGILPKADTKLSALSDLTKEVMTNETKYAEIKQKADASNNKILADYMRSIDIAKQKLELEQLKQKEATKRANIRAGATLGSAKIRANAEVEAAKIRGQSVRDRYASTHTTQETQRLDKAIKNIDADIKNLDVQIATARTMKDDTKLKALMEEQETKKALKTALEQKETGKDNSPTGLLSGSGSSDEDEMDEEERIF